MNGLVVGRLCMSNCLSTAHTHKKTPEGNMNKLRLSYFRDKTGEPSVVVSQYSAHSSPSMS